MKEYEVKCKSCGAPMHFHDSKQHLKCEYCGSELVLIRDETKSGDKNSASGGFHTELASAVSKIGESASKVANNISGFISRTVDEVAAGISEAFSPRSNVKKNAKVEMTDAKLEERKKRQEKAKRKNRHAAIFLIVVVVAAISIFVWLA